METYRATKSRPDSSAIAALDGNLYCGKPLKVKFEEPATGKNGRR